VTGVVAKVKRDLKTLGMVLAAMLYVIGSLIGTLIFLGGMALFILWITGLLPTVLLVIRSVF
jgi:hypothetical protein